MTDTNSYLDIELIKKRAISGVITFTLRTFFIQAFTFFATFILTILLAPEIFGIYFVVSAILNFFVYFSDVGLAAALIQKKEVPTRKDLVSTFTIQQIIIFSLVAIGLLASSKVGSFYKLDSQGLMLLRVLIFSLVLSSLKTIPSILLERRLDFTKLVIPQIAENIVFYITAIMLALMNFGITSFTWAVLSRGIIGLILIYILSPFKPWIGIDTKSAKKLISFGIPFQANSILALLKDDLLTIFIGKLLPFNQVGYIGWAQKWAFTPLRIFMDNVIKITFPAYSRLQEETEKLKSAVEKSIFFVTFSVYPSVAGLVAIAPKVVATIPNYQKWEPALPLIYLYGLNAVFAALNTPLTNILFAIGKPTIILKLMVFWTILTWILTVFLLNHFGYIGIAMASAAVAASTSITIYFIKNNINIAIIKNIYIPSVASLVMFIALKLSSNLFPSNFFGLFLMIVSGGIIYFGISFILSGSQLISNLKTVLAILLGKEYKN